MSYVFQLVSDLIQLLRFKMKCNFSRMPSVYEMLIKSISALISFLRITSV